jgi:hypothetical protein
MTLMTLGAVWAVDWLGARANAKANARPIRREVIRMDVSFPPTCGRIRRVRRPLVNT